MAGQASGLVWEVPPSVLATATAGYAKRLYAAVVALGQYFASRMEAYAKAHAPWTDRTGHARQSLVGRCIPTAAAVVIVIAGLAEYQIWLEVAHGGRWGIILRTAQAHYGEISGALQRLVR
jgi:hypothetical protein